MQGQEPAAENAEKYPLSLRLLHWLMALIILCLLVVGLIMTGLERDDPLRPTLYLLHKSFGVTVLALGALRLAVRLAKSTPPLPTVITAFERFAAHAGHWAFYAFFALMPVTGILMTNSFGLSVSFFGLALPRVIGVDPARGRLLAEIHSYAAYALIALIALHVAGVAFHYLRERVNLLPRMW